MKSKAVFFFSVAQLEKKISHGTQVGVSMLSICLCKAYAVPYKYLAAAQYRGSNQCNQNWCT